jgi:hypothetical protein
VPAQGKGVCNLSSLAFFSLSFFLHDLNTSDFKHAKRLLFTVQRVNFKILLSLLLPNVLVDVMMVVDQNAEDILLF